MFRYEAKGSDDEGTGYLGQGMPGTPEYEAGLARRQADADEKPSNSGARGAIALFGTIVIAGVTLIVLS